MTAYEKPESSSMTTIKNVAKIEDPASNSVTFEVEEINPDYNSHTIHIPDGEEIDTERASESHGKLNTVEGNISEGIDIEWSQDREMPTRTEMQVMNARRAVEAEKFERMYSNAQENHVIFDTQSTSQPETKGQPVVLAQHLTQSQNGRMQTAAQSQSQARIHKGPSVKPKGWDQCVKFARDTKQKGVNGQELVNVWATTCTPAVEAGLATERYKLMCNSLKGAVTPFAAQRDYDVFKLCDSVLTVFHDVLAQ